MPEKIDRSQVLDLLHCNIEDNIAYINFIENNPVTDFYRSGDSILFRGSSDRNWVYVNSNSIGELKDLATVLTNDDLNFGLVQSWMLPDLSRGKISKWEFSSQKLHLPLSTPIPSHKTPPVSLLPEQAEQIYRQWPYAGLTTLEYTRDRIARGFSAAIFHNNQPVAWAITHDDGAIGFLYVLDEYRGKGYGVDVTVSIIQRQRQLGKPAFVHIEPENDKSLSLAGKLGFVQKGQVMWIGY